MSFIENIKNHILIGSNCIWIESFEEQRIITDLCKTIRDLHKDNDMSYAKVYTWSSGEGGFRINPVNGKRVNSNMNSSAMALEEGSNMWGNGNMPNDTIEPSAPELLSHIMNNDSDKNYISYYIVKDFNAFSGPGGANYIRALRDIYINSNDMHHSYVFVIAPHSDIPFAIQKLFTAIDYSLPDKNEMIGLVKELIQDKDNADNNAAEDQENLIDQIATAALGLTLDEAKKACKMSLLVNHKLDAKYINREKIQIIKKSGILTYKEPSVTLDDVGGHHNIKSWIKDVKRCMSPDAIKYGIVAPKGYLSVGHAGCGKTMIAEAIANYLDVPFVILDLSRIMGGIVGESERAARHAFEIIDSLGKCVVLVDEVEKAFGGIRSSNQTDGGTLARVFGVVLEHLNSNKDQFYVMTSNNITQLPPELSRSGRLDTKWFFDFPDEKDRKDIFKLYFNKTGHQEAITDKMLELAAEKSPHFTGAEIANAVNNILKESFIYNNGKIDEPSMIKGIKEVVTVYETNNAEVQSLTQYAELHHIKRTAKYEDDGETGPSNDILARLRKNNNSLSSLLNQNSEDED